MVQAKRRTLSTMPFPAIRVARLRHTRAKKQRRYFLLPSDWNPQDPFATRMRQPAGRRSSQYQIMEIAKPTTKTRSRVCSDRSTGPARVPLPKKEEHEHHGDLKANPESLRHVQPTLPWIAKGLTGHPFDLFLTATP